MVGGSLIQFGKPVENTVFKVHLSEEEKKESSTLRELKGIKQGLELLKGTLSGKRVLWSNDNQAATLIVKFGSMRENLHRVACDIVEICKSSEIELKVEWKSRDDKEIKFYDGVSKDFDR